MQMLIRRVIHKIYLLTVHKYEASANVKMAKNSNFELCFGNLNSQPMCVIAVLVVFLGIGDANSNTINDEAKQMLELRSEGMNAKKIFSISS